MRAVDARGKHLLIRFEGGLAIHSHLRMTGHWSVLDDGRRWPRSARRAWLVMRRGGAEVVQFDGPVLELMTDARVRNDPRIAHLGPDILAAEFDAERFLRRLREDDPTRPIADALIDQQTIAGIGNLWKSEGCFAAGIDPWRPTGRVSDAEALAIVEAVAPAHAAVGRARLPAPRRAGLRARRAGRARAAGRPAASASATRATATARPSGARHARR